ncbi:MAG: 7-cyano-7-deazaguanine synthase QueC [Nitrospirae bacterium]|jgi:7-cyano-7-deazaguanine synthase|nr:7-cyano-7-deazaguanine synthase QueC [Nitrospirota bacterium]
MLVRDPDNIEKKIGGKGSVVLVSGGMDSAVTGAMAVRESPRVAFLHVRYGARAQESEERAFRNLSLHWGVDRKRVVDLTSLGSLGGSALTDRSIDVPPANLDAEGIPSTYVPFRNAHFLSIATSWCEILRFDRIWIGAVEEDSSGYPDCRRIFYDAFEEAIRLGTRPGANIRIVTPVIHLNKGEIVAEGIRLGVPFEHTWSCYREGNRACGRCDSCALRLRGFSLAGVRDPLEYDPSGNP